jgi:hypothetical protein
MQINVSSRTVFTKYNLNHRTQSNCRVSNYYHHIVLCCELRVHHSTVLCDDNILIIGGKKSRECKDNLNSVLSYDIKKNKRQQLPCFSVSSG